MSDQAALNALDSAAGELMFCVRALMMGNTASAEWMLPYALADLEWAHKRIARIVQALSG